MKNKRILDAQFLFQFGLVEVSAKSSGHDVSQSLIVPCDVTFVLNQSDGVVKSVHGKQVKVQNTLHYVLEFDKKSQVLFEDLKWILKI